MKIAILVLMAGAMAWGQEKPKSNPKTNFPSTELVWCNSGDTSCPIEHHPVWNGSGAVDVAGPPLNCPAYQHEQAYPSIYWGYSSHCIPDMHQVTEREWQEMQETIKTLKFDYDCHHGKLPWWVCGEGSVELNNLNGSSKP